MPETCPPPLLGVLWLALSHDIPRIFLVPTWDCYTAFSRQTVPAASIATKPAARRGARSQKGCWGLLCRTLYPEKGKTMTWELI